MAAVQWSHSLLSPELALGSGWAYPLSPSFEDSSLKDGLHLRVMAGTHQRVIPANKDSILHTHSPEIDEKFPPPWWNASGPDVAASP